MKTLSASLLFALCLIGCGNSQTHKLNSGFFANNPVPAGLAPVTSTPSTPVTPSTPSTPVSSGIPWSPDVISNATSNCASQGDSSNSYKQWASFCGCVYRAASTQWSYQDFSNNFETDFNSLVDQNVISDCISSSGIVLSQQDPNTTDNPDGTSND